jgi:DNA-binding transcriptional ArsR family regulator
LQARTSLDETLSALADPTRRRVVELLRRKPHRSSDIADELATTRPAMSRHLRVLRRAGLVRETDARIRVYELQEQPFVESRLGSGCRGVLGAQLSAFKAHAER